MKRNHWLLTAAVLGSLAVSLGQQPGSTVTHGDCSPVVSRDSNVTLTVTCSDKKQTEEVKRLLEKLLASQVPTDVLVQRLEDIESGVAKCMDRRISQDQAVRLRTLLGPSQGEPVDIVCDTRAPDSCGFAGDLENALQGAGWPATTTTNFVTGGSVNSGIFILISDEDFKAKNLKPATALSAALQSIGIAVKPGHTAKVDSGRITVAVQGR